MDRIERATTRRPIFSLIEDKRIATNEIGNATAFCTLWTGFRYRYRSGT
jgi:hypothetical protein